MTIPRPQAAPPTQPSPPVERAAALGVLQLVRRMGRLEDVVNDLLRAAPRGRRVNTRNVCRHCLKGAK